MLGEYYKAAREGVALVEKDWLGLIRLTGSERVPWLQGMVTNDVAALKPGDGCYAAHLNPQGKVVAHFTIVAGEDMLSLLLERSLVQIVVEAFDKLLIMEDVQVADASNEVEIVGLVGPGAKDVLHSWLAQPHEADIRWVATDLGYSVWAAKRETDSILRSLTAAGATPIDRGTWDVLRTEAGLPLYGVDIDDSTVMPELGERGISYTKGCYVGQEVVAKVKYIGHVNRRFVGLVLEGSTIPEPQSVVRSKDKDVGYITTALFSPGLNKPIALGFVNRVAAAAGTPVEIVTTGEAQQAIVSDLPFRLPHS